MNLKYAHVERERRFVLPKRTLDIAGARELRIRDRYLAGTTLRLRKVAEDGQEPVYKLGQKLRFDPKSPVALAHTTMYLTQSEFEALAILPGNDLEKTRLLVPIQELTLAIDEFRGKLTGLTLAEIDLGESGDIPKSLPFEIAVEVTHDERFTGGSLASMDSSSLRQLLAETFDSAV